MSAPQGEMKVGSRVIIRNVDVSEAKQLMSGHGGWGDGMAEQLGKSGVVVSVDSDGDVKVQCDGIERSYTWNPVLLCAPSSGTLNDEGAALKFGTDSDCRTLYYCGRNLGRAAIPGSDGRCGPRNGPQCASCKRYQAQPRSGASGGRPSVGDWVVLAAGADTDNCLKAAGQIGVVTQDDQDDKPFRVVAELSGATSWYALCVLLPPDRYHTIIFCLPSCPHAFPRRLPCHRYREAEVVLQHRRLTVGSFVGLTAQLQSRVGCLAPGNVPPPLRVFVE